MQTKKTPANSEDLEHLKNLLGEDGFAAAIANLAAKQTAEAETAVEHSGSKIILPAEPEKMSIDKAIALLAIRKQAAEQTFEVREFIEGFPLAAAAAFYRVLQRRYGFVCASSTDLQTVFGSKKINPSLLNIRTGPKPADLLQVPHGAFTLPGFDDEIRTCFERGINNRLGLAIMARLKAKDRDVIKQLVAATREELRTNSIYKGKALLLRADSDNGLKEDFAPEFMDTDKIDPSSLILSRDTQELVDIALFTPITHTKECMAHKVPLKRTVALSGPYGTGKTLCAYSAARLCVDNGWTFVMVDKVQALAAALEFARQFEPSVVFAEDIDRIAEHRDDAANDLLNTIDGILAKDSNVMTVLTTNHLDKLQKAMLRPGRIDAVIQIAAPDSEAAQRLVRMYAGSLLSRDEPLDALGKEIAGYIPAVIREIVERSKLSMITRGANSLRERDLLLAVRSIAPHAALIAQKKETAVNDDEALGRAFRKVINGHDVHADIGRIRKDVTFIRENL